MKQTFRAIYRLSLLLALRALPSIGCDANSSPQTGEIPSVGNPSIPDTNAPPDPTTDAGVSDATQGTDSGGPELDAPGAGLDTSPPQHDITASPEDGVENPDQGGETPPPVESTYDTWIGDWTMTPGQETTRCVVKRLDNETDVWIHRIRTKLSPGSHHMIVYRSDDTEEMLEPKNCSPFSDSFGGETYPLMITQVAEEELNFPQGVAFKFSPNQMIRIETHFLNYYPEDIIAHGEVYFDTLAEASVEHEANLLFYGNPDFNIPANSTHETAWSFLPVHEGAQVFALTGHTHQLGTNVEIDVGYDTSPGTPVYPQEGAPFLWDESPVTTYDPPLAFSGDEGFRYRCSWNNTTDKNVGFGAAANDEMCFFWAYYYPSDGYRT